MNAPTVSIQITFDPYVGTQVPEHEYLALARHAEGLNIKTPELVHRILTGWLDQQTLTIDFNNDPVTLQQWNGHVGYDPTSDLMQT